MTNWKLIKLKFGPVPVHFGELGIGLEESKERVHSDTLFSAWVSSYARLFGKEAVELLLNQFQENPPVRMSSTFLYRQVSERTIFYLPRPLKLPINYPQDNDLDYYKTYKGINYLPLEVWQRWYQEDGFSENDRQELIDKTNKKDNSKFKKLKDAGTFDYKDAFYVNRLPKIAIDRVTSSTNFYHTSFIQYRHETENQSGLYFLLKIECNDEDLIKRLKAALIILGEQGIGGERTSGAGQFEAEWLDLPDIWQSVINLPNAKQHHCLLSMFWDNDPSILEELIINNPTSSYEIQERGGWFSQSNIRRKMVRMFAEGSVFPKEPRGKLANVTPNEFKAHKIYRSGICLSLPIKAETQSLKS